LFFRFCFWQEIEKAWKMVDHSHEKESRAKETINSLKGEITNLSKLVEQGAGLSVGQEQQLNDLLAEKDQLVAERDTQVGSKKMHHLGTRKGNSVLLPSAPLAPRRLAEKELVSERDAQVRKENDFPPTNPPSLPPALAEKDQLASGAAQVDYKTALPQFTTTPTNVGRRGTEGRASGDKKTPPSTSANASRPLAIEL
jgi:hypothetical protein